MTPRVLFAVALACALAALAPAPAPALVTIGVADQHAAFLSDPSFARTRIGNARIFVGWDAVLDGDQRDQLDAWMAAAQARGITPLVTFDRSRANHDRLPTPGQYGAMVRTFHARYPWVHEFSTWNEANDCGARTCRTPGLVAQWWRQLRLNCPGCTALAADLVDQPNIPSWVKTFRHYAKTPPTAWGLHNYFDVNRHQTTYTLMTLRAIGPAAALWLTETGGIVSRHNDTDTALPQGFDHAANATNFLLGDIRRLSPQIQRIYLYDWIADPPPSTWDSGMVSSGLAPRKAYRVLRTWLSSLAGAHELAGRLPPGR